MVAAQDERRNRKVIAAFDRQPAVREEKNPAEGLKRGAAKGRCQEHAFRFA